MKKLLITILITSALNTVAQTSANNGTKRILILLDGSGSMLEEWKGTTKWEVAKKLIAQTLDSIQKTDPTIEIGLRVFGHQSPRAMKDCKDSKLEVAIGKKTALAIENKLDEIVPKGNTPIAYALFLAAGDFIATGGTNSIILITDGIENCEGDPCASSEALRNKRITLKPFIIGLGLNESDKNNFDCVGSYYDASDAVTFKNAMNVVISQATNSTTVQINLIDAFGQPTENNVELILYDAFSGAVLYNFVHTFNMKDQPDTLYLDAVEKYNIVAQTTPPVELKNIELNPGNHNIIGIDVPQGVLNLIETGNNMFSHEQAIIRNIATGEILNVQQFNTTRKYITGKYDIEILTLPGIQYPNYEIKAGQQNKIEIELPGVLDLTTKDNLLYSIFITKDNKLEKIYENNLANGNHEIELLPGDYTIVYRSNTKKRTENTKEIKVSIRSTKTYALNL
ncbi:MAG: VWA domain-containing protein [Fimbriimonadaceae bacterium]|nr:VWA domain-containing protein [Chitinophagales bacterium]